MRNVLCLVPKGTQQMVAATIRTVFVQPAGREVLLLRLQPGGCQCSGGLGPP
jgi:hypothetical protein